MFPVGRKKIKKMNIFSFVGTLKNKRMKIQVLDKGFIECQDMFGDELTVVNCARVSFGKQKTVLDENDIRLIRYLLKNKHYSPFRHLMFRFHIKAPEFVMRQWYKHIVGAEWTSEARGNFHAWNEISGRYVPLSEYYIPHLWRKQSTDSKQGSEGQLIDPSLDTEYEQLISHVDRVYTGFLEKGMAKEQARLVLPFAIYTESIWTCSFQGVMNFLELRRDSHSQWEIQQYAEAVVTILRERIPHLFTIWMEQT